MWKRAVSSAWLGALVSGSSVLTMVTFCPMLSQVRQAVAHLQCEVISVSASVWSSVRILKWIYIDNCCFEFACVS